MNIKNIKALAQVMETNGLTAIEISEGDTKIRLEKQPAPVVTQSIQSAQVMPRTDSATQGVYIEQSLVDSAVDFNNITEVKSPMVGVFYTCPAPDTQPFVKIGSRVKKGDILCIIEAMKLMNELTAETEGEIVDICATDGQVIEFSQTLFKIF